MRAALLLAVVLAGSATAQDALLPEQIINAHFEGTRRAAGVKAVGPADGYAFYRRLSLDLTGRIPHRDDLRRYAGTKNRSRLIDEMLSSPAATEFFADLWLQWLNDHDVTFADQDRCEFGPLHDWLEGAWTKDMRYDAFVRTLVSERGSKRDKPTVNFIIKHLQAGEPPARLAGHTARLFLGRDIRCAQCHDDPSSAATQEEFWRFAAFFQGLRETDDALIEGAPPRALRDDFGEQRLAPRFLDGRWPEEKSLGELMVATSAREHARAVVRRYWRHFFGRLPDDALVEPLVDDFMSHGQSLRRLVRGIVLSQPYGLSSQGPEGATGPLKLMSAVQFLNAYMIVFQLEQHYRDVFEREKDERAKNAFRDPTNMRLSFYRWGRDMMYGRGKHPEDAGQALTLTLALRFMNNRHVQQMIVGSYGLVRKVLVQKSTPEGRTEDLFLQAIGRPPTESESNRAVEHSKASSSQHKAFEDVLWALVNSGEFIFIR